MNRAYGAHEIRSTIVNLPSKVKRSGGVWAWLGLLLLGLFVTITPHLTPSGTRLYDLKRILQIVLLAYMSIVPVVSMRFRAKWIETARTVPILFRVAVGLFLAIGLLSSAFATHRLSAFLEVVHFGLLVGGILFLCTVFRSASIETERAVYIVVFCAVTLYLIAFIRDYLFSQLGLAYSFTERPNALWPRGEFLGFANPRYFNQFQTWTLPLLIPLLSVKTTRLGRFLLYSVPALWWALLFASGGRGTIVAIAVAGVAIGAFAGRHRLQYLGRLLGTAVAGGLIHFVLFDLLGVTSASIVQRNLANPQGRFHFWDHALELLQSSPLLGIGPAQYATFHVEFAAHPHNSIIQILSEWGVVAAAIVAVLVLVGIAACFKHLVRHTAVELTTLALVTSLLAGLTHSLFSGLIVTPASQVMMMVMIALVWSEILRSTNQVSERREVNRAQHVMVVSALAILVATEVVLTKRSYDQYQGRRAEVQLSGHRDLPRFWVYGCPRNHAKSYPLVPPG